jgi:FtsP/CotA-like multicopper oxidase with cupredoxin domain
MEQAVELPGWPMLGCGMARMQGTSLSRRRLLQGGAAIAACGLVGPVAGAGPFASRAVEYELEALPAVVELAGQPVRLLTYNGVFPGPLLRAREGERLRVRLINRLDEPTNLHFHGLHVSPAGNADNVFVEVQPGASFTYELIVPPGYGGTFWYHPHRHGALARQLWRGLAGPLVIDPLPPPALAAAEEQILVCKDITVADGSPAPHRGADWARGKSGRLVLVNGEVQPRLRPQEPLVRLRLINACNARMLLLAREDGKPLQVIAHDGHLLEAPRPLEAVLLTPAQRLDLLLALDGAGPVTFVHKPYNRGAQREPSRTEPLFSVHPPAQAAAPALPTRLATLERIDPSEVAVRRSFRMAMAFLAADGQGQLAPIEARLGDVELWEITNVDTQDHVFHLHTWPFRVWRRDDVAAAEPGWRDTINLRPGERVELLIPFRDFAGRSVFHCHIAEHGDAGMMGIIEVRGPGGQRAAGPSLDYGAALCRSG